MLAEVAQTVVLDERCGRGRDEHLPAVARCGDPGRPVDVGSDVALVGDERCPRVQPDPNADRPRGEPVRDRLRRLERPRRGGEGDEEGVPLRIDLDAAVRRARIPHHPPVLGERVRIRLGAELVQKPRRALDVGEEEGDRAGGEIAPHGDRIVVPHRPVQHMCS